MPDDRRGLPDAELRESLELMATLVASMSDRVEGQAGALDRMAKVLAETRTAAFAARQNTDPTGTADKVAQVAERRLAHTLAAFQSTAQDLARQTHDTNNVLRQAGLNSNQAVVLAHREHEAARAWRDRRRRLLTWAGPALLMFLLLTTLLVPRAMAAHGVLCSLAGGNWLSAELTVTGRDSCHFLAWW